MILSTTDRLENYQINHYLSIVAGIAIERSVMSFKEAFSTEAMIVKHQSTLEAANEAALNNLREKARALGADAVVGIQFDYETTTASGSLYGIICTATGTAVKIG